jgi:hypothetical protein
MKGLSATILHEIRTADQDRACKRKLLFEKFDSRLNMFNIGSWDVLPLEEYDHEQKAVE